MQFAASIDLITVGKADALILDVSIVQVTHERGSHPLPSRQWSFAGPGLVPYENWLHAAAS